MLELILLVDNFYTDYIEMIQNKEVIMNGFRNLNKEISNKLYNKMQNVTKQTLEQLKVLNTSTKQN